MARDTMEWCKDEDGDWELFVNGENFGIVCPHHEPSFKIVSDWGQRIDYAKTLNAAKRVLERTARATKAAEIAYRAAYYSADL